MCKRKHSRHAYSFPPLSVSRIPSISLRRPRLGSSLWLPFHFHSTPPLSDLPHPNHVHLPAGPQWVLFCIGLASYCPHFPSLHSEEGQFLDISLVFISLKSDLPLTSIFSRTANIPLNKSQLLLLYLLQVLEINTRLSTVYLPKIYVPYGQRLYLLFIVNLKNVD